MNCFNELAGRTLLCKRGIASIGMTFVILIAGIDLSAGTVITLVNIVCAHFMVNMGMNMYLAVLCSLIISTAIGLLNGFMVSAIGMPAIIATFATQTVFEGGIFNLWRQTYFRIR